MGKLLGPKGNSLKRLQEETMCKMSILGRGSMKDKVKVSIMHCTVSFYNLQSITNFAHYTNGECNEIEQ